MSFERCGPVTYVRNSVWLMFKKISRIEIGHGEESRKSRLILGILDLEASGDTSDGGLSWFYVIYIYKFICNVHYIKCMCVYINNMYIWLYSYINLNIYVDRYFIFTYHFEIPRIENSYTMLLLMAGIKLRVAISSLATHLNGLEVY